MKKQKKSKMITALIPVTAKHIKNGVRGDPNKCALALAYFDATGMRYDFGVEEGEYNNDSCFDLSPKAFKFMQDFDTGKKVKPCILEIPVIIELTGNNN